MSNKINPNIQYALNLGVNPEITYRTQDNLDPVLPPHVSLDPVESSSNKPNPLLPPNALADKQVQRLKPTPTESRITLSPGDFTEMLLRASKIFQAEAEQFAEQQQAEVAEKFKAAKKLLDEEIEKREEIYLLQLTLLQG